MKCWENTFFIMITTVFFMLSYQIKILLSIKFTIRAKTSNAPNLDFLKPAFFEIVMRFLKIPESMQSSNQLMCFRCKILKFSRCACQKLSNQIYIFIVSSEEIICMLVFCFFGGPKDEKWVVVIVGFSPEGRKFFQVWRKVFKNPAFQ